MLYSCGMFSYYRNVAKLLVSSLEKNLTEGEILKLLERPSNEQHGDIAFPCFQLAKQLRKSPKHIAELLVEKIKEDKNQKEIFSQIQAIGPYINFKLSLRSLASFLLELLEKKDSYGYNNSKDREKVLIEYSSPNMAKELHIGHLRSTILGESLKRIYKASGRDIIALNHIGDWGTQFGKIIYAFLKWGSETDLEREPMKHLTKLYVRFYKECENNSDVDLEVKDILKKLEAGDSKIKKIWKKFIDISLEEIKKKYEQLGVSFDLYLGESFYMDKLDKAVQLLSKKKLLLKDEGATIVSLEQYKMPPFIVFTKEGISLYHLRDLAAAIYRKEQFKFQKMLYVVGSEQSLHFQQLFTVLSLMDLPWSKDLKHVKYGLYKFKDEKLSTRKGKSILLSDVLEEAQKRALNLIEDKNPELVNKEEIAREVGLGAVIFNDLCTDPIKDVEFHWDKILDFTGDTGPYVQYSFVRAQSILQKAERGEEDFNLSFLKKWNIKDYESSKTFSFIETKELLKVIAHFSLELEQAMRLNKPSILAQYVLSLAKRFHSFYRAVRVLDDDITKEERELRLALVKASGQLIKNTLYLLCVKSPLRM